MAVTIALAALVILLLGAGLGALAVIVIGIHRVDRPGHRLTDDPRTHTDAATRRFLDAGAHIPARQRNEQDQPQ
jgi:hypothetical protein